MTQQKLADLMEMTRQNIGSIEKGKSLPSVETLLQFARILSVTEGALLSHQRVLARDIEAAGADDDGLGKFGIVRGVPIISWVAASKFCMSADPYVVGGAEETVNVVGVGERCFALRVDGPSMEPEFRAGSLIVVDPERGAKSGDFVVVRLDGTDEATFKQLHIDGGKRFLRPLNPQFPAFEMPEEARVCGVVVRQEKFY